MQKTVFITGTSTGFGKLMALSLAKQGHQVVATMRNVSGSNSASAEALSAIENITVKELDVTKDATIKKAVEETIQEFGKIDVLVNNAGVFGAGLQEAYSIEQVQKLYDINVYGPLRLNREVLPHMRNAQDGLIINISSTVALMPTPLYSVYSSTKFALEGLVAGSYGELINLGIENVLLEPGAYPTEIFQKAGIGADDDRVIASYNGLQEQMSEQMGQAMGSMMEKAQPNPQSVADRVVELVNMDKGKRPLRSIVDTLMGAETSRDIEQGRLQETAKIQQAYGF